MDYRIKGHTPLGVSFTLPLPPTLLNLVPVLREITPGSMLNLLISTELVICFIHFILMTVILIQIILKELT